jgi:hypothetical protein
VDLAQVVISPLEQLEHQALVRKATLVATLQAEQTVALEAVVVLGLLVLITQAITVVLAALVKTSVHGLVNPPIQLFVAVVAAVVDVDHHHMELAVQVVLVVVVQVVGVLVDSTVSLEPRTLAAAVVAAATTAVRATEMVALVVLVSSMFASRTKLKDYYGTLRSTQ